MENKIPELPELPEQLIVPGFPEKTGTGTISIRFEYEKFRRKDTD
jgi:hypothetical protein